MKRELVSKDQFTGDFNVMFLIDDMAKSQLRVHFYLII